MGEQKERMCEHIVCIIDNTSHTIRIIVRVRGTPNQAFQGGQPVRGQIRLVREDRIGGQGKPEKRYFLCLLFFW